MTLAGDKLSQEQEQLPQVTWLTQPDFLQLTGPTIPNLICQFFTHSPSTLFKLGTDEREGNMTILARSILDPVFLVFFCRHYFR